MSTKTMKEKAAELLQKCEVVTFASVNKEGYPRPVPMSKIAAEGISTIWMSTGADSLKTIDFLSNPKAGLCFQEKGDSVALMGEVEVVTDEKLKQELLAGLVYRTLSRWSYRSGLCIAKVYRQSRNLLD